MVCGLMLLLLQVWCAWHGVVCSVGNTSDDSAVVVATGEAGTFTYNVIDSVVYVL